MRAWRKAALALMAAALAGPCAALAESPKTFPNQQDICARATAAAERAGPVPSHLLGAISIAETGRWDDAAKASFAWPWTVTAGGEGRYFATKAEAIAEVKRLTAAGVRNVDVGCMQVNLFYHPDAFASLDDAFDPPTNVGYAARFLADLYAATGSWSDAAGRYHSSDPERGRAYKLKVIRLWSGVRAAASGDVGATVAVAAVPEGARVRPRPAPIDRARTAELTTTHKAERAARRAAERIETTHRQLDAWRARRVAGMSYTHLATMRRAQAAFEEQQRLRDRIATVEARAATLTKPVGTPN